MKWIKHMTNANQNRDLSAVIAKFGAEGYGRWWLLCEAVGADVCETNLEFTLHKNDNSPVDVLELSHICRTKVPQLLEFCQFLADHNLIDPTAWGVNQTVFIPKVGELADEYISRLLKKSGSNPDQLPPKHSIEEDKKKNKKSGGGKTPAPSAAYLRWYNEEFKSRSGGKTYMATFDVDHTLVKQMLADLGEDELKRRTILFLDDTDPWLDKAGRTIKILRSRINAYVLPQTPKFAGMPPPPKDPSCRPGKKFEPVDENSEAYRRYRRLYHGEK